MNAVKDAPSLVYRLREICWEASQTIAEMGHQLSTTKSQRDEVVDELIILRKEVERLKEVEKRYLEGLQL